MVQPSMVVTLSFESRNERANSLKRVGLSVWIPTRRVGLRLYIPCDEQLLKICQSRIAT